MNTLMSNPAGNAMLQLHTNVAQLLAIELESERERFRSKEALVHAAKMAAIGRMVVGVNHEIKRPLASMRLLAENSSKLLARGNADTVADNLQMLVRIMDQLDQLSRQLESFSRKTPMRAEEICLSDVIAGAAAVATPQLQAVQGKINANVNALRVIGDRDRLMLVLVNLIANGLEASADSANHHIEIDAHAEGGDVLLTIRDHGPGMSEEVLEHLFEPFFTTKPPGKGLGMGLALSSEVIAEMGGVLSGGNHPDGGAQFRIRLLQA